MGFKKPKQIAPFHFYTDIGDYTGMSAASYKEFLTSIKNVKAKSLRFHIERGDFEKWVLEVLKDKNLAKEIGKIKKQKLRGQTLRNHLRRIVSKHHKKLAGRTHKRS